jgi:hypothetical protein
MFPDVFENLAVGHGLFPNIILCHKEYLSTDEHGWTLIKSILNSMLACVLLWTISLL